MKPLKTSPFIPEFKRKCSNEILPVQWVSNDSNVRRKLSTSGCGHFLRCLGICARAISESVKRTPRQGGAHCASTSACNTCTETAPGRRRSGEADAGVGLCAGTQSVSFCAPVSTVPSGMRSGSGGAERGGELQPQSALLAPIHR